jgi:hypothetical protein
MNRLTSDVKSLIHYVELSKLGWHEKAIEIIVLSVLFRSNRALELEGIESALHDEIPGYTLSNAELSIILQRLIGSQKVIPIQGAFKITEKERGTIQDGIHFAQTEEERIESKYNELIKDLKEIPNIDWDNFKEKFLDPIELELGARLYELLSSKELNITNTNTYIKFFVDVPKDRRPELSEKIVSFFDPNDIDIRSYIFRSINAVFLIKASSLSKDEIDAVMSRVKKPVSFSIYVDTNFLFSLIGIHKNPADDVADAFASMKDEIQKRIKIRTYVLSITLEEARHTINSYESKLNGFILTPEIAHLLSESASNFSGITIKYIEEAVNSRTRLSPKDYFRPYRENLIDICRSKGIEPINDGLLDQLRTDQKVIDDIYDPNSKELISKKPYEVLLHDTVFWHFINRKRESTYRTPIEAESWIVTLDYGFMVFDRKKANGRNKIPICIHPTALIQLLQLWVPRTRKLEEAMVCAIKPMIPAFVDSSAEESAIKVISTINRFENSDDIPIETINAIYLNESIRSRVLHAKEIEDQIAIVKEALIGELKKAHELLREKISEKSELEQQIEQGAKNAEEKEREIENRDEQLVQKLDEAQKRIKELEDNAKNIEDKQENTKIRSIYSFCLFCSIVGISIITKKFLIDNFPAFQINVSIFTIIASYIVGGLITIGIFEFIGTRLRRVKNWRLFQLIKKWRILLWAAIIVLVGGIFTSALFEDVKNIKIK